MGVSTTGRPWITRTTIAENHAYLFAYARKISASREDAEDLLQDTWISALHTQTSFEGRSSVRTWLVAVMRRRACDRHRRTRRLESFDDAGSYAQEAEAPDGFGRCEARMDARRILDSMSELSPRERDAILLCDVFDVERPKAAAELGLERPYLRLVLHRGRARLHALVSG